jgi:hypothetical protein
MRRSCQLHHFIRRRAFSGGPGRGWCLDRVCVHSRDYGFNCCPFSFVDRGYGDLNSRIRIGLRAVGTISKRFHLPLRSPLADLFAGIRLLLLSPILHFRLGRFDLGFLLLRLVLKPV